MPEPTDRVVKWEWRTDRSWPANPKKHWWFLVGPQHLGKRKAHRQIGIWIRQLPDQSEYHGPLTACGWRSGCDVPIDIVDPSKIEPCLKCWEVNDE
jgi:hypothetical protein